MSSRSTLEHRITAALQAGRQETAIVLDFDAVLNSLPGIEVGREELPDAMPALLYGLWRALDGAFAIYSRQSVEAVDKALAPVRLPVIGLAGFRLRCIDPAGQTLSDVSDAHLALQAIRQRCTAFERRVTMLLGDGPWPFEMTTGVQILSSENREDSTQWGQTLKWAMAAGLSQRLI